jgi:hypothetical protein
MFRRFCFRSRSLVAMLLTICLVSASLWGYSADAMADALSYETSITVPVPTPVITNRPESCAIRDVISKPI